MAYERLTADVRLCYFAACTKAINNGFVISYGKKKQRFAVFMINSFNLTATLDRLFAVNCQFIVTLSLKSIPVLPAVNVPCLLAVN